MTILVNHTLTEKEKQVLRAVKAGKTQKEIASHLGKRRSAVEAMLRSIRLRLGCSNTAQLMSLVTEKGIL